MENRANMGVAALVGLVVVVGMAGIFVGVGGGMDGLGNLLGEEREPPKLLSFEAAGAHCTDDFMANSSTIVTAGGANTEITHARNVSLPGPSYTIGNASFEQVNESAYALSVPLESTDNASRECPGVVRYKGAMRIPAGDNPWHVVVQHNDETITTLYGDSNSTVVGGSAGVGQHVSDGSADNSTETTA